MKFLLTDIARSLRWTLHFGHVGPRGAIVGGLVWFSLALLVVSCGPAVDDDGFIVIGDVGKPEYLPYQLSEVIGDDNAVYPIDLGAGMSRSLYVLMNDWHPPDTLSALIFKRFGSEGAYTLDQANRRTRGFLTTFTRDFDRDGIQEAAVSYRWQDSCFVDLIDPYDDTLYHRLLAVGRDFDGSGQWDGDVFVQDAIDITGDGYPELLCNITAGYDLAPRRLYCLDWMNDSLLWSCDHPGFLGFTGCHPIISRDKTDTLLIHASNSPCNGTFMGAVDDCHSYVYAIEPDGEIRWIHPTGPQYSSTHPQLFHDPKSGRALIYSQVHYLNDSTELPASRVTVFDADGSILDSVDLGGVVQIIAGHQDQQTGEVRLAARVDDNQLWFLDGDLTLRAKVRGKADLYPMEWRDVFGLGYPQLLVREANQRVLVLGRDYQPLAAAPYFVSVSFLDEPIRGGTLMGRAENYSILFSPRKTPVLTVLYNRYRTQLFVLLAVLFGGLVTALYFQRRTRANLHQIARQKEEIERAHQELTEKNRALHEAQAKLIQAEKYRQARDIAGAFAHEIRNALFPARYALNAMRRLNKGSVPLEEALPQKIRQLNRSVTRAIDLTKVISDYTRLDADFKPEPANIAEMVESVRRDYESVLAERNAVMRINGSAGGTVRVGQVHLRMMLTNLIQNALDAARPGEPPRVEVSWHNGDSQSELSITDNGCGIATEDLKRVFDAFYTTRPESGTGLGLATVQRIAAMYEGTVRIASEPGAGTSVTLVFPNTESVASSKQSEPREVT